LLDQREQDDDIVVRLCGACPARQLIPGDAMNKAPAAANYWCLVARSPSRACGGPSTPSYWIRRGAV